MIVGIYSGPYYIWGIVQLGAAPWLSRETGGKVLEARNLSGHLEIDPDGNGDEQGDEYCDQPVRMQHLMLSL